jgi:hypothetical protein
VGKLHILRREIVARQRIVDACPTCARRTRKVAEYEHYYGWTITCCACGERWGSGTFYGERMLRPFVRGWRLRHAAWARRMWVEGPIDWVEGG